MAAASPPRHTHAPCPGLFALDATPVQVVNDSQVEDAGLARAGRRLVAKKVINIGHVALVADAIAAVPAEALRERVCARCFELNPKRLMRSRALGGLCFCSETCMQAAAGELRPVAPVLAALRELSLPVESEEEAVRDVIHSTASAGWVFDRESLEMCVHALAHEAHVVEQPPHASSATEVRLADALALETHEHIVRQVGILWADVETAATTLARTLQAHAPTLLAVASGAAAAAAAAAAQPSQDTVPDAAGASGGRASTDGASVDLEPAAVRTLCRLLLAIRFNAHPITSDAGVRIGTGLYPAAALANHSCAPTCSAAFLSGRSLALVALSHMKAGQEASVAYVDPMQPRYLRRVQLARAFLFVCECERCLPPLMRTHPDALINGHVCQKCGALLARPSGVGDHADPKQCTFVDVPGGYHGLSHGGDAAVPAAAAARSSVEDVEAMLFEGEGEGSASAGAGDAPRALAPHRAAQRKLLSLALSPRARRAMVASAARADEVLHCSAACGAAPVPVQRVAALTAQLGTQFSRVMKASTAAADPSSIVEQLLALVKSEALAMTHPVHRARCDIALALADAARRAKALEVCAQASKEAIVCTETTRPRCGTLHLSTLYLVHARALLELIERKLGPVFAVFKASSSASDGGSGGGAEGHAPSLPPAEVVAKARATVGSTQPVVTACARAVDACGRIRDTQLSLVHALRCHAAEVHGKLTDRAEWPKYSPMQQEARKLSEDLRDLVDRALGIGAKPKPAS